MKNPPRPERPHMPEYGIEPSAAGLLDWSWAEERLVRSHNYWLSSARSSNGETHPHLMALWGVWRDDQLWFSTGRNSRKSKNLRAGARCAVSCESAAEAVIVEGIAAHVSDADQISAMQVAYEQKYGVGFPADSAVLFLRPVVAFAFIEAGEQFTHSATRWRF